MRSRSFIGLMLAVSVTAAAAGEMQRPRVSHAEVDWNAAISDLVAAAGSAAASKAADTATDSAPPVTLETLNRSTALLFSNIAASPVPVLLPVDTTALLRDRASTTAAKPADSYLSGFHVSPFFLPGPGGYDAVVTARAKEFPDLGIRFADPIDIQISGSALVYEIAEPVGMIGAPVAALEADFPGIRRLLLDSYVRYTFVRYGVPYVVAVNCFDSAAARYRMVACRDADKVVLRFLKALRVAGGTPQPQSVTLRPETIDRPQAVSDVFTYHGPGSIMPGSGMKGKTGAVDYTVYTKMRFPLADAPAFANSQSFMNWGDCDQTGRSTMGRRGNASVYRCRVNSEALVMDESAAGNYSYPWRDNFCEHRYFFVGQCPGGIGHQGQDIRPSSCKQRIEGANRCEPYQHDVVAPRDGIVLRTRGRDALYLVVNAADERVRFRYLHMFPKQLDDDEMVSGRAVHEGEVIGKVGNFNKKERATTYHLHFDMQVPTRYGWVFVNPYMTLVAAYERLIHARGTEITDGAPAQAVASAAGKTSGPAGEQPASSAEANANGVQSNHDDKPESPQAASLPAKTAAVPGGGDGGARATQSSERGSNAKPVRKVGRRISRAGPRARHLRRDIRTRHARSKARHRRL